jgi:mono/diheme cytochrome c family protein
VRSLSNYLSLPSWAFLISVFFISVLLISALLGFSSSSLAADPNTSEQTKPVVSMMSPPESLADYAVANEVKVAPSPLPIILKQAQTSGMPEEQISLIGRGYEVYDLWCSACHAASRHAPGTMALHFKYEGKLPPALEMRTDLSYPLLKTFIRNGISVMPSFRRTEISDADIMAIQAYLEQTSLFFLKTLQPPQAEHSN